jgi:uncharacterized protein YqgV (UPF0045/DUF77 family)
MKKSVKNEVNTTVEGAMDQVLQVLEINKASKKTKRAISKVSKRVREDLKKQLKRGINQISKSKNGATKASTSLASVSR